MQRQVDAAPGSSLDLSTGTGDRCPECGRTIEGITATGTGHRFVGCGHSARQFASKQEEPSLVGLTVE